MNPSIKPFPHFLFQSVLSFAPSFSILHILIFSFCLPTLKTETNWILQAKRILPITKNTVFTFPIDHLLTCFLQTSVLQVKEILKSASKNLTIVPNMTLKMYISPVLPLPYWLQLEPSVFLKSRTIFVTLILMRIYSFPEFLNTEIS